MDNNPVREKIKWRLNLFDVIFLIIALAAAAVIIIYSLDLGGSIIGGGSRETVVYTMEFREMLPEAAELIKPGDTLIDKVERRPLGTVLSVELTPSLLSQKDWVTGNLVVSEYPGRTTAIVVISSQASVTDRRITLDGGFIVRVGKWATANGPLYNGSGFVLHIERDDGV